MEDWPVNYTYYADDILRDCFYIKEITNEEEALNWLQEYELSSGTSWTVVRTYPSTGTKILFRKSWKCQFNVRQYSNSAARNITRKRRSSKHLACPATLSLTVFRVVRKRPRSAKAYLRSEFPCELIINGHHNHAKDTDVILRHNKIRADTKEKLLQLFMTGHSATSAREALKLELYIDYRENYHTLVVDNGNVPSIHAVQGLLKKNIQYLHTSKDEAEMDQHLKLLLTKYCEETEGSANMYTIGQRKFVTICSPLMKRAHLLSQSAEMVFVDVSKNMDKKKHRVYMFVTPTPAGAIPLGCIITDSEDKDVFCAALKLLTECFPENSFFGAIMPNVMTIGCCLREKEYLQGYFGNTTVLLCQYNVIKALWTWLLQPEHQILMGDRQEIYLAFKRLVHAESEQVLTVEYENIKQKYENVYPQFVTYVQNLRKEEIFWATCYRNHLPACNGRKNRSSYTEVVFRMLNDIILEKGKAFNLTQLVDFILIRYEGYMERHLLDFSYGRYCTDLIRTYLPTSNSVEMSSIYRSGKDMSIFFVPNESQPETTHMVDAEHGFCTCSRSETRQLCSHLSAVMKFLCVDDDSFIVGDCTRMAMFEVATGINPPEDWLLHSAISDGDFENFTESDLPTSCSPPAAQTPETKYVDLPVLYIKTESDINLSGMKSENMENPNVEKLTEEEEKELTTHFERISNGLVENPTVFVPAVRGLLKNIKNFVQTDSSLQSALYNFGRYTGHTSLNKKMVRKLQIGERTSVQRRRLQVGGKRRLQNGRSVGTKKFKLLSNHKHSQL